MKDKLSKSREKIRNEEASIQKYEDQIAVLKGKIRKSKNRINELKQGIYEELFSEMNLDEVEKRAKIPIQNPGEERS